VAFIKSTLALILFFCSNHSFLSSEIDIVSQVFVHATDTTDTMETNTMILPKFNAMGQPIVYQSSSSSESSASEESFGETIQEQNMRYMREQRLGTNVAPLSTPSPPQVNMEQHVKDVMRAQFPLKSRPSAPPLLTALKKDVTIPLNRASNSIGNNNDPATTTSSCMNLSCGTCDKCRRERNKPREWIDPVLGAVMPAMTNAPVDKRITTATTATNKGITTIVPTSKLISLTKNTSSTQQQGTKSILTPLTSEDYLTTTTTSSTTTPLGNHEGGSCGVKGHRYKEKTEPRVLAPFGETVEQKSVGLNNNNNNNNNLNVQPITAQDRAQFGLQTTSTSTTPVFKIGHPTADRMAVTFDMLQRFEMSPGMTSLMGTERNVMNLACSPCGYQSSDALVHEIKCHHPEFYHLLHVNGLIDHLLYPDLLVVIPDKASLLALPQTRDAATNNLLRYHLVKDGGLRFQDVQGVQQFETMADDAAKVQVEQRGEYGGFHTINGKQLLRSDPNFKDVIFHVRGSTLRPDDVMPVAAEAEPSQPDGGEEAATTSGEEGTVTPDETVQSESVSSPALQMRMRAVAKDSSNSNKSLQAGLDKMNCGFYAPNISLGFSVIKNEVLDLCHGVDIAISVFNTRRLFGDYQANAMNTVSRVSASQLHRMHFPAHANSQTHADHGVGAEYVQYEVNPTPTTTTTTQSKSNANATTLINRSDLLGGLVGLSFSSPYEQKKHTIALCRLEASPQDANVFMSKDESVIMRFRGPYLHLLSINHKALSSSSSRNNNTDIDGLQHEHFIELPAMSVSVSTTAQQQQSPLQMKSSIDNAFYLSRLDKARFDDLLLTYGSLKKFVKKAKRAAGKAAGKAKRLSGKVSSSSLLQVPSSTLLTSEFQAAVDGVDASGGASVQLKIMAYDKSHKARTTSASNQLSFKKADATVGKESILVYVPDNADNQMAADYGAAGLTKFVDLTLSDRAKLSLDVSRLPSSNRSSSVFYTTSGADILVFRFGDDGSLTALYSINKRYDLARRLIQARQK